MFCFILLTFSGGYYFAVLGEEGSEFVSFLYDLVCCNVLVILPSHEFCSEVDYNVCWEGDIYFVASHQ